MLFNAIARASMRPVQGQRRTFINWMTNYPDKINELKKAHQAGGRSIFTWEKQPNDKYVTAFGVGLTLFGVAQLIPGHYRLATGKGKMD